MILGLDAAARDYIVNSPQATALMAVNPLTPLVLPDLGKDINPMDAFYDGWVFKCTKDNIPYRNPEGSGQGSICVTIFDSWATSSYHTSKFPNLLISIYADRDRDFNGNPIGAPTSSKDRALRIFEAIHPLFDDVPNRIHSFPPNTPGAFPIISTVEGGGFYINDVSAGDGVVRLDQIYNVHTY